MAELRLHVLDKVKRDIYMAVFCIYTTGQTLLNLHAKNRKKLDFSSCTPGPRLKTGRRHAKRSLMLWRGRTDPSFGRQSRTIDIQW